jgi:hypothetical protein
MKNQIILYLIKGIKQLGCFTEAGLLNKGSCSARTLGVTKFINMTDMILVTLCCAT